MCVLQNKTLSCPWISIQPNITVYHMNCYYLWKWYRCKDPNNQTSSKDPISNYFIEFDINISKLVLAILSILDLLSYHPPASKFRGGPCYTMDNDLIFLAPCIARAFPSNYTAYAAPAGLPMHLKLDVSWWTDNLYTHTHWYFLKSREPVMAHWFMLCNTLIL